MRRSTTREPDTYPGFWNHLGVPLLLVVIMWAVYLISVETGYSFSRYGLYPRTAKGLLGIFTIPFIHGSWEHLMNNSVPMLVLGWALFKFYRPIAWKTLIGIYLMSGIWLWISGRPSYHIGASGVVYGLAAFLFISGWLRREKKVASLSLLVAFMYGGLWWGVLPVDPTISWEGHLWGGLSGLALGFLYRNQGPVKRKYQWEIDEEIERELEMELDENETAEAERPGGYHISYTYIPRKEDES